MALGHLISTASLQDCVRKCLVLPPGLRCFPRKLTQRGLREVWRPCIFGETVERRFLGPAGLRILGGLPGGPSLPLCSVFLSPGPGVVDPPGGRAASWGTVL